MGKWVKGGVLATRKIGKMLVKSTISRMGKIGKNVAEECYFSNEKNREKCC